MKIIQTLSDRISKEKLDALKAVGIPTVEVHISDVASREDFRQVSYVRAACVATVCGEGIEGYRHALRIIAERLN